MAKRVARQKTQLPSCYYEGYLEKRSFKDKTSRKLWTCLCGNSLFFFNEKRDMDYVEKLDLRDLISLTDDNSQDRNLDAARLNMQMKDGNIKFTVPSAEARELWKGFIYSVTELSVPSSLNLLPGQIQMLKEAVEREQERLKNVTSTPPAATNSSPYVSLIADMPACFYNMTRMEAELLLEREAKRGNMVLRPGSDGNNFAVSTRQDLDGSIFKHYRVTRKPAGGFNIDVDDPVPCATLHDVINYLVEKTDGVLIPLIIEEQYEKNITFFSIDNENGEKSVQQAASNLDQPNLPPKSGAQSEPTPEPVPTSSEEEEEAIYQNDQELQKDPPKKAIMPPTPAPRKSIPSTSPPSTTAPTNRVRSTSDVAKQTLSELKMKLEQKAKCVE